MFYFSQRSLSNMAGIDQRLISVAKHAIVISHIDFGIPQTGGVRTAATQFQLFQDGRSKADGYKKRSKHQDGEALDFFAYIDGKASWDHCHLSMVANAMLQAAVTLGIKIKWGGLFHDFIDMPHIELIGD